MAKRVVDAKQDSKGNIISVKLSGNKTYTPLDTAMNMVERGQIENAHTVRPKSGTKDYLRTNPNNKRFDNLDDMAKD